MARVSTSTTLNPGTFSTGNYIREEDAQAVQEMLNYAFQHGRRMHLFVQGADDGWGASGNEIGPHRAVLPDTTGAVVIYRWQLWIDPDAENIEVGCHMDPPASNDATAEFAIGSWTSSFSTFSPSGSAQSESADVATIGSTGLVECTLTVEHTTGSDPTFIEYWWNQEEAPTVPVPPNE